MCKAGQLMPTINLKIYRCNRAQDASSSFDQYQIEYAPNATLLEVLDELRAGSDATLAYDSNCRLGLCASCAMAINGKVALACQVNMQEWVKENGSLMLLEPKSKRNAVKDLVTDAALARQLTDG